MTNPTKRIVMIETFANERECLQAKRDGQPIEVETELADQLVANGIARLPAGTKPPATRQSKADAEAESAA